MCTESQLRDIKELIELASTTKKADKYIEEFTENRTFKQKLDFVTEIFDVELIGRNEPDGGYPDDEKRLADDYEAVLNAIINKKWR